MKALVLALLVACGSHDAPNADAAYELHLASIGDSDAYRAAKAMVGNTYIAFAFVTADTTYEIGVTLPSGEHHDIVVCPGGNPWPAIETRACTTYDFAGAVAQ